MTAPDGKALLTRLAAVGVGLSLNEAGDGLTLSGTGQPPASLLEAVRAAKPELLALLRAAKEELSSSSPPAPLPAHLAAMVKAARAGQLPRGAVKLSSGLITDLEGYVLAWAECWPRDRAHVLRRLEEAHLVAVVTPKLQKRVTT